MIRFAGIADDAVDIGVVDVEFIVQVGVVEKDSSRGERNAVGVVILRGIDGHGGAVELVAGKGRVETRLGVGRGEGPQHIAGEFGASRWGTVEADEDVVANLNIGLIDRRIEVVLVAPSPVAVAPIPEEVFARLAGDPANAGIVEHLGPALQIEELHRVIHGMDDEIVDYVNFAFTFLAGWIVSDTGRRACTIDDVSDDPDPATGGGNPRRVRRARIVSVPDSRLIVDVVSLDQRPLGVRLSHQTVVGAHHAHKSEHAEFRDIIVENANILSHPRHRHIDAVPALFDRATLE